MLPPFVAIAVRPRPGVWEYVRVNVHELSVEQLTVSEYLRFKEELVDGQYVLLDPVTLSSALLSRGFLVPGLVYFIYLGRYCPVFASRCFCGFRFSRLVSQKFRGTRSL